MSSPWVPRLGKIVTFLKSNPSGFSFSLLMVLNSAQVSALLVLQLEKWREEPVVCSQAWAGLREGNKGARIAGMHTACFGTVYSLGYSSSQSSASPAKAGKSPGMTEGALNSSSDYGFCESGCVCINWTWLLAAGFPAHNHHAF